MRFRIGASEPIPKGAIPSRNRGSESPSLRHPPHDYEHERDENGLKENPDGPRNHATRDVESHIEHDDADKEGDDEGTGTVQPRESPCERTHHPIPMTAGGRPIRRSA